MLGRVRTCCIFYSFLLVPAFAWAKDTIPPSSASLADNPPIPELDCVMEPSEIVDAGSAVPGVLEAVYADRSDVLRKGEIIAQLESRAEEAILELTKAQADATASIELRQQTLNLGELTVKRNKKLLGMSAISKQDMDTLLTKNRISELEIEQERDKKRMAELEYQRARAVLERRTIRSPVDGVVMERFKAVGEYLEDEPVLRVAKLDPLYIETVVPVDYLGQISAGMKAEVSPQIGGQERRYVATVERVDRIADAASGTFGVRLSLANANYAIAAGLRCKLAFLPADEEQQETIASVAKGETAGHQHHWVRPRTDALEQGNSLASDTTRLRTSE